ncbi:hypothetical protein RJ641_011076 [Dillenia turbinata]|uniref:LysM domain-containing protein n=1 Tax=Dillenia turbinata TaxID=194707 RepID=A0AAN8Z337_9MAGN
MQSLCGPQLVCKMIRNFKLAVTAWEFFCWVAYQPGGFVHDVYTVSRMITKLREGNADLVDQLIHKIEREGIISPVSSLRLILDFYGISKNSDAALRGDLRTVQNLFGMVRQSAMGPDAYMYKVLILAYRKCGRAALAFRVFEKLGEAAAVEERTEQVNEILPSALPGHIMLMMTNSSAQHRAASANILSQVTAQSSTTASTDFSCSSDMTAPCNTYVTYRALSPEFLDLGRISDLFGVSRLSIAEASNLVSEEVPLVPDQLLLIPISCGCNGNHSFANISYQIQKSDTFYYVSTTIFENLTNYHVVEDLNPTLEPTQLDIGDKVVFPLFCKCPRAAEKENGFKFLITYVWQPGDDLLLVSSKLNVSAVDMVTQNNYRNFTDAVNLPTLIPVSELPVLSQPRPPNAGGHSKHRWILITLAAGLTPVVLLVASLLVYVNLICKKKKAFAHNISSLETADLIQMKGSLKEDNFEPKIVQDKLLPGVSGYLCKPVIYETRVIMEATMNLNESYRIGGTVYRAMIDGQVFAVKKRRKAMETKEHGEIVMLWKDIRGILEDDEENRADRLKKWMDPTLGTFYPIDGALSLAALAKACMLEKSALRPQMTEIVLNLAVLVQASSNSFERSWILEPEEINQIINPIKAR